MEGEKEREERIRQLRAQLEELKSSVPAHSSSIHHIARMEELEEEIERLEGQG